MEGFVGDLLRAASLNIERDPYELPGLSAEKRYPVKRIREIALQQYPLLAKLGTEEEDFGWADLMFIESRAMLGAMFKLMDKGIPSLTVHDSLIVPVSKGDIAQEVLDDQYRLQTGASPVLRVSFPLPSESQTRDDAVFANQDFGDQDDTWDDPDPYGFAGSERDANDFASESDGDEADSDHAPVRPVEQQHWSSDDEKDGDGYEDSRSGQGESHSDDDCNEYDSSLYF
jgi:hypothetical protein